MAFGYISKALFHSLCGVVFPIPSKIGCCLESCNCLFYAKTLHIWVGGEEKGEGRRVLVMDTKEETGSTRWGASLFLQTTEDVARAVAAAASEARSPRPSVIYSSKGDDTNSPLQRLQRQVNKVLKGFSSPPQVKTAGTYNPEVLTTQKRQWANFQLQYLVSFFHSSQLLSTNISFAACLSFLQTSGPSISEGAD